MSRVFIATDTTLRRIRRRQGAAAELAADVSIARFQREIALAARLQHPHIVALLSTGDAAACPTI
jgi:serine/threonine-protein kinase